MIDINQIASAFERFELSSHDPKWSSWVLEQLFDSVLNKQHATMTDLLHGFDLALKRNDVALTDSVANLIKDTVVTGFSKHRSAYNQAQWMWANEELANEVSAARAYFFLHALPPNEATSSSLSSIIHSLEGTARFDEAIEALSDDFARPDVKQELLRWMTNGMKRETADKLTLYL
jgi:hypothetical protein